MNDPGFVKSRIRGGALARCDIRGVANGKQGDRETDNGYSSPSVLRIAIKQGERKFWKACVARKTKNGWLEAILRGKRGPRAGSGAKE
jgi:hypothetical protein